MVTFLAEITNIYRLGQKAKATLLAAKRSDGLWVNAKSDTVELPYSRLWYEKQLVIVDIDLKSGRIDQVIPAVERLVEALKAWSDELSRMDERQAELAEFKASIEYQAIAFAKREEDFKRRSELLALSEKKLEEMRELAQQKLSNAIAQQAELAKEWKRLHERESKNRG